MSWKEDMYEAIGRHLAVPGRVVALSESMDYNTGCPTCGPDVYYSVDIRYVMQDDSSGWTTYSGRLTDLIAAIT